MNKLITMIKRAFLSNNINDSGRKQIGQGTYLNKTGDIEIIMPYGLSANPPVKTMLLTFNVLAQEENKAAIPYDPPTRFLCDSGEVVVGNPTTRAKIHFLINGDITIETTGNVNIDAPTTNISGDLKVTGDITGQGDIKATGEIIYHLGLADEAGVGDIITTYNTHTHDETGSITDAPNQQLP